MAGGKETPRQKMIGMMYIVLTALLALNVSSTVIDKFVFLNASLEHAVQESSDRNSGTLKGIEKRIQDLGNRDKDKEILALAQEIHNESLQVISDLDTLKAFFVNVTGGYTENNELVGKTDYDRVGHEMLPDGNNHCEALKKRLNDYAAYMTEKLGEDFDPIALDADDDPYWKTDPNQKGKGFAQLAFESTPTPAGMATVSEYKSRIMQYETRAMDILAGKVGAGDLSFDEIKAMVRPESKTVAAGTHYTAELFLTASASGIKPTMTVNGEEVPVSGGLGLVDFVAPPGNL